LAIKANGLIFGADNIRAAKRKIYAVFADNGLSEGSAERLKRFAAEKAVPLYVLDGLPAILHKPKCLAAAIAGENIWKGIKAIMNCE